MTTVETIITLGISPKSISLEELESKIGGALQEAGKQLLLQAFREMEAKKLEQGKGVLPSIFLYILEIPHDGIDGSYCLVAVALMGPLCVVVHEPGVEIALQGLSGLVELGAEGVAEELVQHGAIEPFHEAIGLRAPHFRAPMLNVVQLQVDLVGMAVRTAELPPVVGEQRRDLYPMLAV